MIIIKYSAAEDFKVVYNKAYKHIFNKMVAAGYTPRIITDRVLDVLASEFSKEFNCIHTSPGNPRNSKGNIDYDNVGTYGWEIEFPSEQEYMAFLLRWR